MVKSVYFKKFSSIPRIQQAEELCYRLIESKGEYSLEVSSIIEGEQRAQMISLPGLEKEVAVCLLQYLYENAVRLESCQEVIDDCIKLTSK